MSEADAIFGTSSGESTDPEDADDGESEKDNKHCTNEKQSSAHKNHISADNEKIRHQALIYQCVKATWRDPLAK